MKTSTFLLAVVAVVSAVIAGPRALAALSTAQTNRLERAVHDKALGALLSAAVDHDRSEHTADPTIYDGDDTDVDLTRASLRAYGIFGVNPSDGMDFDISNDADFEAEDIGRTFIFYVNSAGDSAAGITLTDGASGVVVKRVNAVGTSCEDITDHISCKVVETELVMCRGFCAD